MPREHNFLLSHGERLAAPVDVPSGGGDKNPPYDFERAKQRLGERLSSSIEEFSEIPDDASPGGEVVALLTMHPRYVSKSDFPQELLEAVGLRPIGSRPTSVKPENWGVTKHPEETITEEIFVAGSRDAFAGWARNIRGWTESTRGAKDLGHVEDVAAFRARDKLRSIPKDRDEAVFEIVLHNAGSERVVEAFISYARRRDADPLVARRRDIKGLTFIPVRARSVRAEEIARFSFVRVARVMPALRPMRPGMIRSVGKSKLQYPQGGPLDPSVRAAVFDGGLPNNARSVLQPWVTYIEPVGIGPPLAEYQEHGLWVTSALLFGPLPNGNSLPRPICAVDHIRVLDANTGANHDLECLDALDRILAVLDKDPAKYRFVNISVGPHLAITDDEVTQWTAALDERLSEGRAVVTVAAGNGGNLDEAAGLNRIQPPADAVNVLTVGASDRTGGGWRRAGYSCPGPGRSPGVVKPDGMAFGGSDSELFMVPSADNPFSVDGIQGTSAASALVLRSAVSVHAQVGHTIGPLANRALLIHRADAEPHDRKDVGWGRFDPNPEHLITCDDDEALIVFQGVLPIGEHLRAPVPVPKVPLKGNVILSATLVIAPDVDPEHPGAYTRSGLEVSFRPHAQKYKQYPDGRISKHPKTISFFSVSNIYGGAGYAMRDDGHKWEPCLRNGHRFQSRSLLEPCFDIYYHHRQGGTVSIGPRPIPYALVVSLKAAKVPDLYNQVVRAYANVLIPVKPRLRIHVQN